MRSGRVIIAVLAAALALSACSRKSTGDPGPDEFSVLPVQALQEPASYNDLPAPREDGINRADTNPIGRAIALLGGTPSGQTRLLGSTDTATSGGGLLGGIFSKKRDASVLDPKAEAARLTALGIPVTGN